MVVILPMLTSPPPCKSISTLLIPRLRYQYLLKQSYNLKLILNQNELLVIFKISSSKRLGLVVFKDNGGRAWHYNLLAPIGALYIRNICNLSVCLCVWSYSRLECRWIQIIADEYSWMQINTNNWRWLPIDATYCKWMLFKSDECRWIQINKDEYIWV